MEPGTGDEPRNSEPSLLVKEQCVPAVVRRLQGPILISLNWCARVWTLQFPEQADTPSGIRGSENRPVPVQRPLVKDWALGDVSFSDGRKLHWLVGGAGAVASAMAIDQLPGPLREALRPLRLSASAARSITSVVRILCPHARQPWRQHTDGKRHKLHASLCPTPLAVQCKGKTQSRENAILMDFELSCYTVKYDCTRAAGNSAPVTRLWAFHMHVPKVSVSVQNVSLSIC
jgi:hypothetical protein